MYDNMLGCHLQPTEELPAAAAASMNPRGETPLDQLPLAMAYTPMQKFRETYDGLTALQRGTIFPELDLPFCGRGVK